MTLGLRGSVHSSVLRHLEAAGLRVQRSVHRLASGERVATAADDPAGLGVSERMRARLLSQRMAARNVSAGIGLARAGEAALAEVSGHLIRLHELAVSSANGTHSSVDLAIYQAEWDGLVSEIARLNRTASFGEQRLLGSKATVVLQVGVNAGEVLSLEMTDLEGLVRRLKRSGPLSPGSTAHSMTLTERAIDRISSQRSLLATGQRRLESAAGSLEGAGVQLAAAEGRVRDADVAVELAELTAGQLAVISSAAILTQANREGELVLELLAAVPPPGVAQVPPGGPQAGSSPDEADFSGPEGPLSRDRYG